jgi:hypothetical protein
VSEGPDPDKGDPFVVFQALDTGMVSIDLPKGMAFVTPDVAEAARVRLGAAITAARAHTPPK